MAKQPPARPRPPKREVSDLTFSPEKWRQRQRQQTYSRSFPDVGTLFKWTAIFLGVGLVTIVVTRPRQFGGDIVFDRGPVDTRNLLNFPPPSPNVQIQGTAVRMGNGSPDPMTIRLKGDRTDYTFTLPGCRDCGYTTDPEVGSEYCDRGPEQLFAMEPGLYEATITFIGSTQGFRSTWVMAEYWEYSQCIFSGEPEYRF
jgi:hypothetical protein